MHCGWYRMLKRQGSYMRGSGGKKCIGTDEKPADLLVNKTSEYGFDFMFGAGIHNKNCRPMRLAASCTSRDRLAV